MNFAQSEKFSSINGVVHGFANRNVGTDVSGIKEQFDLSKVAQLKQIHSGDVIVVSDIENHRDTTEGDALVTNLRGVGIGVRTADCVPILLTDRNKSVIAAVHAGWRGTYLEVALNTVKLIESEFGIAPEEMIAVIGPSIKSCCYEIGADVADRFSEKFQNTDLYMSEIASSKYLLDLSKANKLMLQSVGVEEIEILDICTKCENNFYSYRREGKGVSTQLSFIALIP
jgi:YfiH family protein